MEAQRTAEPQATLAQLAHHQRPVTRGRRLRVSDGSAPLAAGAGLAGITALIALL